MTFLSIQWGRRRRRRRRLRQRQNASLFGFPTSASSFHLRRKIFFRIFVVFTYLFASIIGSRSSGFAIFHFGIEEFALALLPVSLVE